MFSPDEDSSRPPSSASSGMSDMDLVNHSPGSGASAVESPPQSQHRGGRIIDHGFYQTVLSLADPPTAHAQYLNDLSQAGLYPSREWMSVDPHSPTPYSDIAKTIKKSKEGHVARPMNNFMVFAQYERWAFMQARGRTGLAHNNLSKHLSATWKELGQEIKDEYKAWSAKLKAYHQLQYPNYNFRPDKKKAKKAKNPKEAAPTSSPEEQACSSVEGSSGAASPAPGKAPKKRRQRAPRKKPYDTGNAGNPQRGSDVPASEVPQPGLASPITPVDSAATTLNVDGQIFIIPGHAQPSTLSALSASLPTGQVLHILREDTEEGQQQQQQQLQLQQQLQQQQQQQQQQQTFNAFINNHQFVQVTATAQGAVMVACDAQAQPGPSAAADSSNSNSYINASHPMGSPVAFVHGGNCGTVSLQSPTATRPAQAGPTLPVDALHLACALNGVRAVSGQQFVTVSSHPQPVPNGISIDARTMNSAFVPFASSSSSSGLAEMVEEEEQEEEEEGVYQTVAESSLAHQEAVAVPQQSSSSSSSSFGAYLPVVFSEKDQDDEDLRLGMIRLEGVPQASGSSSTPPYTQASPVPGNDTVLYDFNDHQSRPAFDDDEAFDDSEAAGAFYCEEVSAFDYEAAALFADGRAFASNEADDKVMNVDDKAVENVDDKDVGNVDDQGLPADLSDVDVQLIAYDMVVDIEALVNDLYWRDQH